MPHISPRRRAQRFLDWLAHHPDDWKLKFHGRSVVSDNVVDRLAEVIGDAQEEVREGFLKPKISKNEAKTHG